VASGQLASRLLANCIVVGPGTSEQTHVLEIAEREGLHLAKLSTEILRELRDYLASPGLAFVALKERLTDRLVGANELVIYPALCRVTGPQTYRLRSSSVAA